MILVGAVAVLIRIEIFLSLLKSPLRYFHLVPGLDMQTLLGAAEWGKPGNVFRPFLTLPRALTAAIWYFNGKVHVPEVLFLIQQLGGAAVAVLCAWTVLHVFRNRLYALVSGVVAATYAPALLYECTTLQESLLTLAFFAAIPALLAAHREHFQGKYTILAGALLAGSTLGRPTCILWVALAAFWCVWKARWRKGALLRVAGGIAAVWLAASLFNGIFAYHYLPFFPSYYIFQLGGKSGAKPTVPVIPAVSKNVQPEVKKTNRLEIYGMQSVGDGVLRLSRVAGRALARIPQLFRAHEIPDNLNYYFFRERFSVLNLLPGPYLVWPLALAGILLMLFAGGIRGRPGWLLLPLLGTILPLCAIQPFGRYRLLLYGLAAVWMYYPIYWSFHRPLRKRRWLIAAPVVLAVFAWNPWENEFLRSSDWVAWGLACEQMRNPPDEPSACYAEAYLRSGGNEAAAVNLLRCLMNRRQYAEAENLLEDAMKRPHLNPSLMRYYRGLLELARLHPAEAERYLRRVDVEKIEKLRAKYYFFLAESLRLSGRDAEAREYYRRSAASAPDAAVKRMLEKVYPAACEKSKEGI